MKEATGELNMTVITVVAIAAVGTLFTLFVWPNIQSNLILSNACAQLDTNGHYVIEDGTQPNTNGYVICNDGECDAWYNEKNYHRVCHGDATRP